MNRPPAPGTSPVPTPIAPVPEKPGAAPPPPPPATQAPTGVVPPGIPPVTTGAPVGAAPPRRGRDTLVTPRAARCAASHAGADHCHGPGDDVPGRRRTVGAGVDQQRVAGLGDDVDHHVQPERAARAQRAGRHLHAAGGVATFTPQIDAAAGRVDIAITRTGDQVGASGAGLLAALLFDAVAPGSAIITANGVASTPRAGRWRCSSARSR